MKKNGYQYFSALSFLVAGNIIEAHNGLFGWWNIPSLAAMLLGFILMEAYARRYND